MIIIGIALVLLLLMWGFMVFPAKKIARFLMFMSGLLVSVVSLLLCFRGLSVIGIPGFFFGIGILSSFFPFLGGIFGSRMRGGAGGGTGWGSGSVGGSSMDVDEAREILGVGSDATVDEIQSAYRDLMKRFHPDHSGGSSAYASLLNRARDVLLQDHRRRHGGRKH